MPIAMARNSVAGMPTISSTSSSRSAVLTALLRATHLHGGNVSICAEDRHGQHPPCGTVTHRDRPQVLFTTGDSESGLHHLRLVVPGIAEDQIFAVRLVDRHGDAADDGWPPHASYEAARWQVRGRRIWRWERADDLGFQRAIDLGAQPLVQAAVQEARRRR